MQKLSIPYHKTTHQKLSNTILKPLMLCAAALVLIIPLAIYGVLSWQNTRSGREAAELLEHSVSGYSSGIRRLAEDPLVVGALEGTSDSTEVYRLLYNFRNAQKFYSEFQLASNNRSVFIGNDFHIAGTLPYYSVNDVRLKIRLSAIADPVEYRVTVANYISGSGSPVFSINARIDSEPEGMLSFVFTNQSFKDLFSKTKSFIIVTNEYSHIIYSELPFSASAYLFAPHRITANLYGYNGARYIVSSQKIPGSTLTVYSLSESSAISTVIATESLIMVLVVILIAVFVYRSSLKLTVATMAPFDSLVTALERFDGGDRNYRIPSDGNPETGEYIDLFNNMLDDINRLIDKNNKLTEQTRLFEVRLLYSQFNPHFMFNMLDNIKYTIGTDPTKAREMIVALSKMLRYTLDNVANTEVPLKTDIKYIEDYLALQKYRLGDSFSYSISIEPRQLLEEKLPQLVAQPVVENAIAHGLSGDKPVHVDIEVKKVRGNMEIVVSDNGQGMTSEELARVRGRLKRGTTSSDHIGLLNSNQRLKLLYGPKYGLRIESEYGVGTTVSLKIKLGGENV